MNEKEIPEVPPGSYNVNQDGVITDGEFAGREVRGYGLRAQDFNGHMPYPTESRLRAPAHQYTREQKGHSVILWVLFGGLVLWIPAIYFSVSPRHYWHV